MIPVKDRLMAMIRDLGGEINENDCRIPNLLKQLNELLANVENDQDAESDETTE